MRRSRVRNHRRLRIVYFSLASVWGLLTGTVAVLVALSMTGRSVQMSAEVGLALIGAALFALIGAAVAARAYREAVRRVG